MARVLATDQAQTAVNQIQSILSGDLEATISKLDAQGKTLSDPNVWDGPLATQFRNTVWPEVDKSLRSTKQQLEGLRTRLDSIQRAIREAGGASS
jgi:hypothetical protein